MNCSFCGLPITRGRANPDGHTYCCSGCALAAKLPLDWSGRLTLPYVTLLGYGFCLFNQFLFITLALASAAEGDSARAAVFAWLAGFAGALALVAVGLLIGSAPSRSFSDWAMLALGTSLFALGCWLQIGAQSIHGQWLALLGNLGLGLWISRGWIRRLVRRN
jgi:hypothetical protein